MPRTGAPPMIGDTPTTFAGPDTSASRSGATARIGAIDTTGLLGATRTTSASASASRVRPAAQGVHDAVQVGTDPQAVQGHVVADVDDRGDLGAGGPYPGQEARPADAPRQYDDSHADILPHVPASAAPREAQSRPA